MRKCTSCLKYYDENISRECPYCEVNNLVEDNRTVLYSHTETAPTNQISNEVVTSNNSIPSQNVDNQTIVITNLANKSLHVEPVVGWLIVIKGEGMGSDHRIVSGMNSIGRNIENKIVLDYGDNTISSNHAIIIYDYKNNIFFFQHGGGTNLSYVNDSVVLQPIELKSGDIIGLGHTELRFVPFCDNSFNWNTHNQA